MISIGLARVIGGNIVASISAIFQARVLADGGTFEAQSCLDSTISTLQNINLA